MREPNEIRVLATGFGAFPGARVNASAAIAAGVARASRRFALFGSVSVCVDALPVVWTDAERALRALIARAQPDIIVLIGLAGRRTALSVESRALNRRSILRADAAKRTSDSAVLSRNGPFIRPVRLPVARSVAAMRRAGAPAQASIDAGDYLCNAALYAALGSQAAIVGSVHAPRPRDPFAPVARDGRRRGVRLPARAAYRRRRPTLEAMTRAVVAIVPLLLAECRARQNCVETIAR